MQEEISDGHRSDIGRHHNTQEISFTERQTMRLAALKAVKEIADGKQTYTEIDTVHK